MPKQTASDQPSGDHDPATPSDAVPGGVDFETALAELEQLVDQMEAGDMTLEASLSAFERGVKLTRHCQTALRTAELKVKQLTQNDQLEALDPQDLHDD